MKECKHRFNNYKIEMAIAGKESIFCETCSKEFKHPSRIGNYLYNIKLRLRGRNK